MKKRSFIRIVPADTCKMVSQHRVPKYAASKLQALGVVQLHYSDYFIGERDEYVWLGCTVYINIEGNSSVMESETLNKERYSKYRAEYNKLYYALLVQHRIFLRNLDPLVYRK